MNDHRIESLPNELLIEIFEYIDMEDLFHGCWNLNARFNNLIRVSQNLSYNLQRLEPTVISLFANQITRLILNTWQEIDLYQFPALKSLILHQITTNQLRQIRPQFLPHLIHLSTSAIPEFPPLTQDLFSNTIPSIRHINLGHVHVPSFPTWSQSPSLSSVAIQSTDPTLIPMILLSSPNLICLRVYFQMDTNAIFQNSLLISNHPLREFLLSDPYHRLSFNHIYTILAYMPNVRRIQLNFRCTVPFLRFAQRLIDRLRNLKQFDCYIDDASHDRSTTVETIRQIHPCFHRIECSINGLQFRTFTTTKN